MRKITCIALTLLCSVANAHNAKEQAETLFEAVQNGYTKLEFRPRYEFAKEHDSGKKDGQGLTIRSRLSFETMPFYYTIAAIELTNVSDPYHEDLYNGINSGKSNRVLIPDPKGTGISKFYFEYQGLVNSTIRVGRQPINLDNQKFVGERDFRQYSQSFDAISLSTQIFCELDLFYALVTQFNSIESNTRYGGRSRQFSNLLNVSHSFYDYAKLSGYLYQLNDREEKTNSSSTIGARIIGDIPFLNEAFLNYATEFAFQMDTNGNPVSYHAKYYLVELGAKHPLGGILAGFENQDGSSSPNKAFKTPFGTKHKFFGWADIFSITPDAGIKDAYLKLTSNLMGVEVKAEFHWLRQRDMDKKIGTEIDFSAEKKFDQNFSLKVEYAKFNPRRELPFESTKRIWLTALAKFG